MFGLMKILRKEQYNTDERLGLSDLSVGSTIGFGFMPQKNISGCRMTIKAVNTYFFSEESFPAYTLDGGEDDINLIVSKDENQGATYLSLSQRINAAIFSQLFEAEKPENWFSLSAGDAVNTSNRVMGMRQSWIAPRYKMVMHTRGSMVEGAKPPYNLDTARKFDYVMLADDTGEHALEAEKYEDGSLMVYATVYRPVTDIGEISGAQPILRKQIPAVISDTKTPVRPTPDKESPVTEPDTTEPPIKEPDVKNPPVKREFFVKGYIPQEQSTVLSIVPKNTAMAKEEKSKTTDDRLNFDAKLAVGIINEAQRNNMSIESLIRKVIDLPAVINDEVSIQFPLSVSEYNDLTQRYHLEYSDHAGVKENIVKELQQFIGFKK